MGEFICQSPVFKECMQLINFQSQVKLIDSIKGALKVIGTEFTSMPKNATKTVFDDNLGENFTKTLRIHLLTFLGQLQNASNEASILTETVDQAENDMGIVPGNRYKLKEVNAFLISFILCASTNLRRATRESTVQPRFASLTLSIHVQNYIFNDQRALRYIAAAWKLRPKTSHLEMSLPTSGPYIDWVDDFVRVLYV